MVLIVGRRAKLADRPRDDAGKLRGASDEGRGDVHARDVRAGRQRPRCRRVGVADDDHIGLLKTLAPETLARLMAQLGFRAARGAPRDVSGPVPVRLRP